MTGTNTGIVILELAILALDRAVQYLDCQQKKAFITEDLFRKYTNKKSKFTCSFFLSKTFQLIFQKSVPFPPTGCQAASKQAPMESRPASYSAGVSHISSIQLGLQ
ncbi:hypothetical protein [Peribacillus simplex]|uniref:hypothetical protein n=1 Tax=Peribacillus simplex TaxID=1478 RepID=UPI0036718736